MSQHHYALRAVVLIRLQELAGQWVPLASLVAYTAAQAERVQHVCQQLVDAGEAVYATREGRHYYGTRVEGVPLQAAFISNDPSPGVQPAAAQVDPQGVCS